MNRLRIALCGTALLIVAAVVVVLRINRRQPVPLPEVSVAQTPAEVRIKAVERKSEPVAEGEIVAVSDAVVIVCGEDAATADRYEARNDALRSIMRSRSLTKEDAAALMAYLASTNDAMRVERVAALKNDVMNLLRSQETPVAGLADALVGMFDCGAHPRASAATPRRCLFCARRFPLPAATQFSPSSPSGFSAIPRTFRDYHIL